MKGRRVEGKKTEGRRQRRQMIAETTSNKKFLRGSRGRFLQKEPPGRRRLFNFTAEVRSFQIGAKREWGQVFISLPGDT
jgi:hypothetical protein